MLPHQQRVIEEAADLSLKVSRLGNFLFGPAFDRLDNDEKYRLTSQYGLMEAYLRILDQRLTAFQTSPGASDFERKETN